MAFLEHYAKFDSLSVAYESLQHGINKPCLISEYF